MSISQNHPRSPRNADDYIPVGNVPHARQAESAVLAAVFQDTVSLAIATDKYRLVADDFFFEENRIIFEAILAETKLERSIDRVSLAGYLGRIGQLDTIGGEGKLVQLSKFECDYQNVETYLQDVKNASTKRYAFLQAAEISRLAQAGSSAKEVQNLLEKTAEEIARRNSDAGDARKNRFNLIPVSQFKNRPRPSFLIDNILVSDSTASMEGEPGCYKSFLSIAFAACVATGLDWCGHKVKKGSVVYISGEGASGLGDRLKAWEIANNMTIPDDFLLLPESVQFAKAAPQGQPSEVEQFINAIKFAGVTPSLIVVDTLARCMVGSDENSSQDMGNFVDSADRIKNAFGCTVMTVHHHGKNGKVRGSSSFAGSLDTRITVDRSGDKVTLKCPKQKDWPEFIPIVLEKQVINTDNYGHTSLAFGITAEEIESNNSKLELCLSILQNAGRSLKTVEWQKESLAHGISRASFFRIKNTLFEQNLVSQSNGAWNASQGVE